MQVARLLSTPLSVSLHSTRASHAVWRGARWSPWSHFPEKGRGVSSATTEPSDTGGYGALLDKHLFTRVTVSAKIHAGCG